VTTVADYRVDPLASFGRLSVSIAVALAAWVVQSGPHVAFGLFPVRQSRPRAGRSWSYGNLLRSRRCVGAGAPGRGSQWNACRWRAHRRSRRPLLPPGIDLSLRPQVATTPTPSGLSTSTPPGWQYRGESPAIEATVRPHRLERQRGADEQHWRGRILGIHDLGPVRL